LFVCLFVRSFVVYSPPSQTFGARFLHKEKFVRGGTWGRIFSFPLRSCFLFQWHDGTKKWHDGTKNGLSSGRAPSQKTKSTNHDEMPYEPKNILITGGAGFIASHVAILFAKKYPQCKVR